MCVPGMWPPGRPGADLVLGAGESTAGGLVSGPRCWARFQFFQVEACLHMLSVLIFLEIKPVCSLLGGGRLSSEAFVTIIEMSGFP